MAPTYGVIFDMDGVLVDSYDAHLKCWQRLAEEIDQPLTQREFELYFGRTAREMIRELWGQDSLTDEEITKLEARKESFYHEMLEEEFPEMPGAKTLIENLQKEGFKIAVGSSGPPENVNIIIEQMSLAPFLNGAINGNMVEKGKPDPAIFLKAAEAMQIDPSHCLVIEDAPPGIEAAHAAGMTCIGIASTGRTVEELQAAEEVITQLSQTSPDRIATIISSRLSSKNAS
ncbi:Phosphorylated carbohydrates phosphatase [Planctomycetales bacterium 10988]|nr:Phosphorylated carbohydrates phosphatase [Planctomycetales bacterium 10988]